MKKPTIEEILNEAKLQNEEKPFLRIGQCFFNILHGVYPELAEEIRGTQLDPFYKNHVKEEIIEYLKNKIE